MRRVRLQIIGKVQDVFFRQSALDEARRLGLQVAAENCDDGSVRIFVEGEDEEVDQFISWCNKGPPTARVDQVNINE